MPSPADRWEVIRTAFGELVDLPAAARPARLDQLAGRDAELRAEIVALLAAADAVGDRFEPGPPPNGRLPRRTS